MNLINEKKCFNSIRLIRFFQVVKMPFWFDLSNKQKNITDSLKVNDIINSYFFEYRQ